ncbi:hypothetical protein PRIPAC_74090 [Pristionchus pacificus]|uniref:NADAR domain-containing protein n=1 Tax=Pristionchus pacificus TaxID=54126 RepID=A0A2A6C8P5_PRIPA|nr:hypothetical protein PRIPAC_74090 [Pristionchus pacificus]|eukprot:PDM74476.1 hypothetical protein PRIPAC_41832 [Pristionchus pacificus]
MTTFAQDENGHLLCLFYSRESVFSNHYPCAFFDNFSGQFFSSSEQYYMYQKALFFNDPTAANKIMCSTNPRRQKKIGDKIVGFSRSRWDRKSTEVMREAVILKFSQNRGLLDELLATGEATLAECSPRDTRWGIGFRRDDPRACDRREWRGENRMGNILMDVRNALRMV